MSWIELTRNDNNSTPELVNSDNVTRAYPDLGRLALVFTDGLLVNYRETLEEFKKLVNPPPPQPAQPPLPQQLQRGISLRNVPIVGERVRLKDSDRTGVITSLAGTDSLSDPSTGATVFWDDGDARDQFVLLSQLEKL